MKKYIAFILGITMVFLCCSCVNSNENGSDIVADSTTEETTEDTYAKYMSSDNCVVIGNNGYYEIPNEFKPFECSKEDYADLMYARINDSFFSVRHDNEWVVLMGDKNDSTPIFEYVNCYGSDYRMVYIKDSLFFVAKKRLYKLTVNESCKYEDSDFSLVADFDAIPCFVEENKMYLLADGYNGNPGKYYVLDTLTGECKPTDDIDKVLDKAPSNLISKKKAEAIALDALNNGIEGTEYQLSRKDANIVETKLIHKPDSRCDVSFENSPEYVYEVFLTGNTLGVVPEEYSIFVNAKSGKISMINYFPMDN